MRVIDLLRHTSGLTYGFQHRTNVDAAYRSLRLDAFEAESLAALVEALARVPLEFSPGTSWNYGVSTDVVGHLVSLASGLPFDEFVRSAHPAAARHARHRFPRSRREGRALRRLLRRVRRRARSRRRSSAASTSTPPRAPSGGGGLVGTAADYLRFCEMLRRGGELDGVRLLGPKTLALMRANHLPGGRDLADISRPRHVLGGGVPGRRLRPRLRDDDRPGRATASCRRPASSRGAEWRRPRSGSTRSRTSASSS